MKVLLTDFKVDHYYVDKRGVTFKVLKNSPNLEIIRFYVEDYTPLELKNRWSNYLEFTEIPRIKAVMLYGL